MISTLLSIALLASSTLAFKVTTENAAQCGDLKIQWDNTNDGPYYVEILNPEDPCGDAITSLGEHDGSSMTKYGLNLAAGTKILVYVESANDEGWSDSFTVGDGAQDCLPASLQTSVSAEPTSSKPEKSSSASAVVISSAPAFISSSAPIATPSVISSKSSSAAATSSSAPAIVGAAGNEPLQGDGALSVTATGSVMALSAVAAFFALL